MTRPYVGQQMGLDEFLKLPEEKPWLELIDGVVSEKQMGSWVRGVTIPRFLFLLYEHPATKGGQPYPSLTIPIRDHEPGNAPVPDGCYYKQGRDRADERGYPLEVPDLVVEIHSDGRTLDYLEKRLAFLRDRGVRCTILIDPDDQTLRVAEDNHTWTATASEHVTLDSLDGFDFDVSALFKD